MEPDHWGPDALVFARTVLRSAAPRVLFATALLGAGCGPTPAVDRGQALFASSSLSRSPSNVFACATCHTPTAGDPSHILPGYTLHDVTSRPSWWGGAYDAPLDAVNECLYEFMRGDRLPPDDVDGRSLLVYLQSLSPDATAQALPLTVVKTIADVPNGDPGRGKDTYTRACANCHGDLHTGSGRLGPAVSVIPEESIQQHGLDPLTGARPITIEKVRHGKFFNVGGNMPLYSVEALSDAQLGDILAYMFP
jgi:thiosulfate dehydrogenase